VSRLQSTRPARRVAELGPLTASFMRRKNPEELHTYPLTEVEKQRRIRNLITLGYFEKASDLPDGAIPADTTIPANAYYSLPVPFYTREEYYCRDCGKKVVWTALEKYQYYEIEKGNMYTKRVRCDLCYHKGT
jgi:Probable zinc-ribbon domain